MTESDLDRLLLRASRRLRMQTALRVGVAALGSGIILMAAVVFWMRFKGSAQLSMATLIAPPIAALLALSVAFVRSRPPLMSVAQVLDRRAQAHEQLVTWYEFRGCLQTLNPLQAEFKAAQRAATLQVAAMLDPRKLLPLSLPDWSRAIWLALILLCCALLMPPQIQSARHAAPASRLIQAGIMKAPPAAGADGQTQQNAPRVQVLSPTELSKIQLMATDSQMPQALKAEALKDLESKIGVIPESDLAPEVREVLDMLRKERSEKALASEKTAGPEKTGGHGESGRESKPEPAIANVAPALAMDPAAFREKAITVISAHFPDVLEALDRYYGPVKK